MKKQLKIFATLLIICSLFSSCGNIWLLNNKIESNDYSELSDSEVYIKMLFARDELCSTRSAKVYDYPDFFYEMEIVDKNGNKILFSDLSSEEKEFFVQIWKEKISENMEEKTKVQKEVVDEFRKENIAFLNALDSTDSRMAIHKKDISKVFAQYQSNLEKIRNERTARSLTERSTVTNNYLNPNSIEVFKNNYKRGRILITLDSSSSSSAYGLGHASLMDYENDYRIKNPNYEKINTLESWSISSYPQTISCTWEGQRNGVQFEPLGLWAGESEGGCSSVYIYDMQKIVWVWDWFRSGYRPFPADENDYNRAADYAENSMGIGYGIISKESRSLIYCSALVWQSWRYLDRSYDMSAGFQVTPLEIANSMQTQLIAAYSNH